MTVDYNTIAGDYRSFRIPDKRIAALIDQELQGYNSVLNVGAGQGAYEPRHCQVIALEPSAEMTKRRPKRAAPAIQGSAESIPYPDNAFEASMAILTIHHWQDFALGLAEMHRVSKYKILLFTWIDDNTEIWMQDYFPEILQINREAFPTLTQLESCLGKIKTKVVPIAADCTDGFLCAYWQRPREYLNADVRAAISTFAQIKNAEQGVAKLRADIESGAWHKKYGYLMHENEYDFGYRLITSDKAL